MSNENGHRYQFGAPTQGWPQFDKDGHIIREPEEKDQDAK